MKCLTAILTLYLVSGLALLMGRTEMKPMELKSQAEWVQPMTGVVFWDSSEHRNSDAIHLEFSYVGYSEVVSEDGDIDFTEIDKKLDSIAKRGHQAILRFYFVIPGKPTRTPRFLKKLKDYRETEAKVEGRSSLLPDWSHPRLKKFVKDFHKKFAQRYDRDPRLAFVQIGFGSYAEYHLYQGPLKLGNTFPDREFQSEFLIHLARCYQHTPWSISVDAAKKSVSPFLKDPSLLNLNFGLFDDSFLCRDHAKVNVLDWDFFGRDRYLKHPAGGELSYYTDHDQVHALSPKGPHGESFESAASRFHLTYMIGNDQPQYQSFERIRQAGVALGYRFRIVEFLSTDGLSQVTVRNEGIAPIYRDAYVSVDGVRGTVSLRGLAPHAEQRIAINAGSERPVLRIESDHLVKGQRITFDADLSKE